MYRSPRPNELAPLNALRAIGDLLTEEGSRVGIVVVGGVAMIIGGFAARLTQDVDIIAVARSWVQGVPSRLGRPDPLPVSLVRARSRVARDFNLPENWMNCEVGAQWETGLPRGFAKRVRWLRFGGLALGVADRRDLIFLKLYAAVDSEGPQSVHYQDLLALRPTSKELAAAARWAKSQDTSAEFAQLLKEVLGHVRRDQQESH